MEWRWWGDNPLGYHCVNVLLHAIDAVLVWIILKRLRVPGAWVAGLVFAIHPVNVATAAWISEQKNTLSMFFYALTILLYLWFEEENHWRWYGLALGAFLLALFSKTAVVMLPVVLLGCVWWQRRRIQLKDLLRSAPFFALSLVLGLITMWFHFEHVLRTAPVRAAGFMDRLAAAGWVPWFYLYKALVPANLMVIYPQWEINVSSVVSYVPGMILVGSLTLFWWKRGTWGRPLLFGLGYFVVMLFPVLGFFEQSFYRFSLVADHWQYYAIVGPIALGIAPGELLCRRLGGQGRYWGSIGSLALLLVLGAGTWRRSSIYANDEMLWSDNVAKNPNAWLPHYNLGNDLLSVGNFEEAIVQFQETVRLKPDNAKVHSNLGIALAEVDRGPEAIEQFEEALQIDPNYFEAHGNLGHVLILQGRVPEAIEHWEQALQIKPDSAEAHCDLGMALEKDGKLDAAAEQYELALKFKPGMVDAQNQLRQLRARQQSSH